MTLKANGQLDKAIQAYHNAIRLDDKLVAAYGNLAIALRAKGQWDQAFTADRTILTLQPGDLHALRGLALTLYESQKYEEAICFFSRVVDRDPTSAEAHYNLGNGLKMRGKAGDIEAAIRSYQTAIQLDPGYALAHYNLGITLDHQGQRDKAISCYRTATELEPTFARAHSELGHALMAKKDVPAAVRCYRAVVNLPPRFLRADYTPSELTVVYCRLGDALLKPGTDRDVQEAIRCYRTAIKLDPGYAVAYINLGCALLDEKMESAEAISSLRTAIKLDASQAPAHFNLGRALLQQGQFAEARESMRRTLELLRPDNYWHKVASSKLKECDRLAALETKLPDILKTARSDDPAELLLWAQLCQYKQLNRASARFYADAFARNPELADNKDLATTRHRYHAACVAALAAAGQGKDADKLDNKERYGLRLQAYKWLRAEVIAWISALADQPERFSAAVTDLGTTGVQLQDMTPWLLALHSTRLSAIGGEPPVRPVVQLNLERWLKDPDLAGVRDPDALAGFSKTEKAAWVQLWAKVTALSKQTEGPVER